MMFKKGSFEIGGTIYPVAIKVGRLDPFNASLNFASIACEKRSFSFTPLGTAKVLSRWLLYFHL